MGVLRICFRLRFFHSAVLYNSSVYLCPQMMAASIFPSGRMQTPDQHLWLLCLCPALSSSLLPLERLQKFIFTVTETNPQKVLQQGSVSKIVYLHSVSKQSISIMPSKIRIFFQLSWLSQEAVCAFPHCLSILLVMHSISIASEPQQLPSLWLYKVCAGATTLVVHWCSQGREWSYTCAQRPWVLYKICLAQAPGWFGQAAQLAAARVLSLEETSLAKEARRFSQGSFSPLPLCAQL